MTPVTFWLLGRQYCPACVRILTIVRHPESTEFQCPVCDGPTRPAHTDEESEQRCPPTPTS